MPKVPDPIHDSNRLKVLEEAMIAVANLSGKMDEMAAFSAAALEVPISLITFVAADEQYFKGEHGLPATLAVIRKMPISYSICQFTVRDPRPLVIQDTEIHPLLKDHPSVRDMGIRAYLGIPLILCGQAIGSLSFVDYVLRKWTAGEQAEAQLLGRQVVEMLEQALYELRAGV